MDLTNKERTSQSGYGLPVSVTWYGGVAVLTIKRGENRCNMDFVATINQALDQIESNPSLTALITTGDGKFYCNGLDLKWMAGLRSRDPHLAQQWRVEHLHALYARILMFPVPTIAAINGHCFAAGCNFSLCHDYRIMREDRGWWCLNEVITGVGFDKAAVEFLRSKMPTKNVLHDAVVLGRRYIGSEALAAGIIHQIQPANQIIPQALELANQLANQNIAKDSLQTMKKQVYGFFVENREDALKRLAKL